MDDLYRDEILEHYREPHNFGTLDAPSASFEGHNPLCGDRITMMLIVDDQGAVADVAFSGRGCAISQASASMLTDEIRGMAVSEVQEMTNQDILDLLGIPETDISIDWNTVIFNMLTIRGVYGREMYETWYKMSVFIETGLDLSPIITHRLPIDDFQKGFDVMESGQAGKVVLDWSQ